MAPAEPPCDGPESDKEAQRQQQHLQQYWAQYQAEQQQYQAGGSSIFEVLRLRLKARPQELQGLLSQHTVGARPLYLTCASSAKLLMGGSRPDLGSCSSC